MECEKFTHWQKEKKGKVVTFVWAYSEEKEFS